MSECESEYYKNCRQYDIGLLLPFAREICLDHELRNPWEELPLYSPSEKSEIVIRLLRQRESMTFEWVTGPDHRGPHYLGSFSNFSFRTRGTI